MSFCTAINCMDGRTQLPVIHYLQKKFNVTYVDMITAPGHNRILAENICPEEIKSIFSRLKISIKNHQSVGIAVIGHFDCAGNPVAKEEQCKHTKKAIEMVKKHYKNMPIIGLWVDEEWKVSEVA